MVLVYVKTVRSCIVHTCTLTTRGPLEGHFEFMVLSQDRKPAKQQTDLLALKSFTVPDTSSLSFS